MVWASTSSGLAARRGPGGVEVDALGALQHLGHRQAGGASTSAGLAVTSFWYSATARSMSPSPSASWAAA